ncbi:MAG: pyrroloquinoline quinone biosynthesis protein PqqE [Pseudomonadota bacterium]
MSKVGSNLQQSDRILNEPQAKQVPLWLLAELTYRCPLRCSYCSNPMEYDQIRDELNTEEWKSALEQARKLGAVQLGFSGGEPLLRNDLEELVRHGRDLGYYTNVITSGIGLTEKRAESLKASGLDHIQLSFQASSRDLNDAIGGGRSFERKLEAARCIKASGYPMVLNIVLHRHNIERIDDILKFAISLGANYVELANAQYDGWAFFNRDALLPSATQVQQAEAAVKKFRDSPSGKLLQVFYVVSDYFEGRPKACSGGWGKYMMLVCPDGLVLPCHGARKLPLKFDNVKDSALEDIWKSPSFSHFRGDSWLPEPCRSCPDQSKDFGGCRCQAFLLTGDMKATDPACSKSLDHALVASAVPRNTEDFPSNPQLYYRGGTPMPDLSAIP